MKKGRNEKFSRFMEVFYTITSDNEETRYKLAEKGYIKKYGNECYITGYRGWQAARSLHLDDSMPHVNTSNKL